MEALPGRQSSTNAQNLFAFVRVNSRLTLTEYGCLASASAFLAHSFCTRGSGPSYLLEQPESNSIAAAVATQKSIPLLNQDIMGQTMHAVHHLIDAAPGAEFTRRKIV